MPLRYGHLQAAGLSLLVFACVLVIWQAAIAVFQMHPIVLPSPLRVAHAAWLERWTLAKGLAVTGAAASLGLLCSIVTGSLVAIVFSQSKWLRAAFYPYVVFLQTVPIVAIAPLLITWFGYGFQTVVLVATIISLFPIISNVTSGLVSIDEHLKDLFRLNGASRWQTLWKLRIPHAISQLILGTRVSAGLAVIGAIIGEFFVGNGTTDYAGLGTLMTGWQNLARTDALMAVVLVAALLGLLMIAAVNLCARCCLWRWTSGSAFESD